MTGRESEFIFLENQRGEVYKKQIHPEIISRKNWLRFENEKSDILALLIQILDEKLSRIIGMADNKDSKTSAYLILFTGAEPKNPCLFITSTEDNPLDYSNEMPYLGGNGPKSADIFLKILQQPAIPLKLLYPREDILATYLNNSGGSNPDFNCFTLPTRIPLLNVRYFYEQKQQSYCHRLPRHVDIKAVNPHIKYRQSND